MAGIMPLISHKKGPASLGINPLAAGLCCGARRSPLPGWGVLPGRQIEQKLDYFWSREAIFIARTFRDKPKRLMKPSAS